MQVKTLKSHVTALTYCDSSLKHEQFSALHIYESDVAQTGVIKVLMKGVLKWASKKKFFKHQIDEIKCIQLWQCAKWKGVKILTLTLTIWGCQFYSIKTYEVSGSNSWGR